MIKPSKENSIKQIRICDAGSKIVNGSYTISSKENNDCVFVHQNNANLKIMKISGRIFAEKICPANKIDYHQFLPRDTDKEIIFYHTNPWKRPIPPSRYPKLEWFSAHSEGVPPNPKSQLKEFYVYTLPIPRIIQTSPIPKGIVISFECEESIQFPYLDIWSEIYVRNITERTTKTIKTQMSPFVVRDLDNDSLYTVQVATCSVFNKQYSKRSEVIIPLSYPPKPSIVRVKSIQMVESM